MPGAELTETLDDRNYKGKVTVKLGPVALTFAGKVEMSERDDDVHRMLLRGSGMEQRERRRLRNDHHDRRGDCRRHPRQSGAGPQGAGSGRSNEPGHDAGRLGQAHEAVCRLSEEEPGGGEARTGGWASGRGRAVQSVAVRGPGQQAGRRRQARRRSSPGARGHRRRNRQVFGGSVPQALGPQDLRPR